MSITLGAGGVIQFSGNDATDAGSSVLRRYDPSEVLMIWGGIPVTESIAKGTFITVSRNTRTWTLERGCDGEMVRVRTEDQSGLVRLTLMAGSRMNSVLSSVAGADEITGLFACPLFIRDFSGRSLHTSAFAYIEVVPDKVYSTVPVPVEWTFVCRRLISGIGASKKALA